MTPKEIKEQFVRRDVNLVDKWNETSVYRTLGIEERLNFLERRLMVAIATLSWTLDHLIALETKSEDDGK